MSVGNLSSQQLKSLVEDKWHPEDDAPAVGLHVTNSWKAPSEVEFDFGTARVVRADTVFQVREALSSAERGKRRIILLTKLQQCDLGNDVVARLPRSRLFAVDHWASLCSLFKVKAPKYRPRFPSCSIGPRGRPSAIPRHRRGGVALSVFAIC